MAITDLIERNDHEISTHGLVARKRGYAALTLTGDVTLDDTHPGELGLNPGGAGKTVTLDGTAGLGGTNGADPAIDGLRRVIFNRAAGAVNLTVEDADGGSICTINQNEAAILYHDGQDGGAGWTLVAILSIALS